MISIAFPRTMLDKHLQDWIPFSCVGYAFFASLHCDVSLYIVFFVRKPLNVSPQLVDLLTNG